MSPLSGWHELPCYVSERGGCEVEEEEERPVLHANWTLVSSTSPSHSAGGRDKNWLTSRTADCLGPWLTPTVFWLHRPASSCTNHRLTAPTFLQLHQLTITSQESQQLASSYTNLPTTSRYSLNLSSWTWERITFSCFLRVTWIHKQTS